MLSRTLVVMSMVALASGCFVSKDEFREKAAAAAACAPGDTCVAVGPDCMCPIAVNEKRAQELRDEAEAVFCGGASVACEMAGAPVCLEGLCQYAWLEE